MKRSSIGFGRWLVLLFASNAMLAICWSACLLCLLALMALLWYMLSIASIDVVDVADDLRYVFTTASLLFGFAIGVTRVGLFHPAFDKKYADWLATSNWRPGLPLPKGPLHPTKNDAIGLVLLSAIAGAGCWVLHQPPVIALVAPAGVFFGVALTCVAASARTGRFHNWRLLLSVALLSGLLHPSLVYVSVPIAALLAYLVELRDLRDFPWPPFALSPNPVVGWPYRHLLDEPRDYSANWPIAALEGLLAGTLCLVSLALSTTEKNERELAVLMLIATAFVAPIVRIASASSVLCERLCLGERLGRRRLVVWRHDRWLLAALAVLAIPIAFAFLPIEHRVIAPLAAGLGLFAARVRLWDLRADFYTGPQSLPPWRVPPQFNANSHLARQPLRGRK
jgi:hypothetical protein